MKQRSLSDVFMDKLLSEYKVLTDYVKTDDTLDMEFRGKEVMVYYRGGRLLTLSESGIFTPLDKNYGEVCSLNLMNLEEYIPKAKHLMDKYQVEVKANLSEKEISQRIVMENNYSPYSNDTDYFIVDMEYCQGDGENYQFDLIGIKWLSTMVDRKKLYFKIVVMETKQGCQTLRSSSQNPGLKTHYEDFMSFLRCKAFKAISNDMAKIFCQKCELGLVRINERSEEIKRNSEFKLADDADFIAILANYKPASSNLCRELNELSADANMKFATSGYMGYGLFDSSILSLSEMKSKLKI